MNELLSKLASVDIQSLPEGSRNLGKVLRIIGGINPDYCADLITQLDPIAIEDLEIAIANLFDNLNQR